MHDSERLPTVRIESGDGFITINESDFDPTVHKRVADPVPPAPPPPPPPPSTDPLDNLPPNWRDTDPKDLRALAASITGRTVENVKQAIQVIEKALADRK